MDLETAALIAALRAQLTAAQSDLSTAVTSTQREAARAEAAHITSALALLTATPTTTRTYVVQATPFGAESLFLIAQQQLGDWQRFGDVQIANNMRGIALDVGQTLVLPA